MKLATLVLAAGAVLAAAAPIATPAGAEVVRKTVTMHRGAFGHGCRTVRTVHRGFGGRRVDVRRICR